MWNNFKVTYSKKKPHVVKYFTPATTLSDFSQCVHSDGVFVTLSNFSDGHLDPPANGQAVIYLTGLLEVFISESLILATVSDNSVKPFSDGLSLQVDFPSGFINRAQLAQLIKRVFPKYDLFCVIFILPMD